MPRLLLACISLLIAVATAASASVGLSDVRSWPFPEALLARDEPLWIQVDYRSDTPLRLQARAYRNGRHVDEGQKMNASAVHPQGSGSALVWVAFYRPAVIDEIRITAYDAEFRPVATRSVKAALRWTEGGERRPTPAWVEALLAQERSLVAAGRSGTSDAMPGPVGLAIALAIFGALPAYLVLQMRSLTRWQGAWRIAAALPLLGMVPVLLVTARAFLSGANLWPLGLLFSAPVALLFLLALVAARRVAGRIA